MKWFNRMQHRFRFGIDNLMIYITATMLAVFVADYILGMNLSQYLTFIRPAIFRGQIWRLVSFIVLPPQSSILFILFSLYFYYFIGSSLERAWGANRFTFYYLCGIIGTILAGLIVGGATNTYLNLSLFLAFAQLFPDTQVLLFFIIPVKIKYLGYLNWALFALSLIGSLLLRDLATFASLLVSLLNFFLFFGGDFIDRFRDWKRYGKGRRQFKKDMKNNDNNFWR